jgi:2-(3-amino-3-carboxypropyl)histidine synthase
MFLEKFLIKLVEFENLKIQGYDINLEKVINSINKHRYKQVVLQFPEGLKSSASHVVDYLQEKTDADFVVSADPCYGACDLGFIEFKKIGIDFIVQLGHLPMPSIKDFDIPAMFVNAYFDFDIEKLSEKIMPFLKDKKIGLTSSAQHAHLLKKVKKNLEKNQFEVFIGKGDDRIFADGQILGCNFSAASSVADKVDMFLFIGSGNFHPMGLILSAKKPVIAADPYTFDVKTDELVDLKDMVLKQRYGAIASSKDAKVFGILVGLKEGQQRIKLANQLKKSLTDRNKKAYVLILNYFSPDFLQAYRDIDCLISTACPRIAIDDYLQYKIPIITPVELEILLGFKKWEDYHFDEIFG